MTLFRKKKNSVGDDDNFVTLIQVAREDANIMQQLLSILSQERKKRGSILNSYINDLQLKKAPVEFISAIACLLQDDIADKTLEILKER